MIEQLVASACQALSGATVEWRCEPHGDHQRIYFANHTSHLDFVVIWAALPATRPAARAAGGRSRLLVAAGSSGAISPPTCSAPC